MGCWKIVKLTFLPPGAKPINCRCIYKLKFRDDHYECHCAHLIDMGYLQKTRLCYFESLSHTYSYSTIRLVLAIAAVPGWYSLDLVSDAVCAFILIYLAL